MYIVLPSPELKNLYRFKRVLVWHGILFKKVAIMHNTQFLKLEGAICNIPIELNDVMYTLPCGPDFNGLLMFKRKSKLSFHV